MKIDKNYSVNFPILHSDMVQKLFLYCFISTILLVADNCFAQKQDKKESYKSLKSRASSSGASQLLNEADALKSKNPDEALDKIKEALAMSIAESDDFNEGRSYILLAEINEGILEWKLAFENYNRAYDKLSSFVSSPHYITVLMGLGNTSLKLQNYDITQLEPLLQGTVLDNFTEILATRDGRLSGLVLSEQEVDDITEFMKALTDPRARTLIGVIPMRVPSGLSVDGQPGTR